MNLTKTLFVATALMVGAMTSAQLFQEGKTSNGVQLDMQTFQNSQLTTKSLTEPIDVDGNPFLFEKYMPAKIYFVGTDQAPETLYLNYNIYANLMKMSNSVDAEGEVRILGRNPNLDIVMEGMKFRHIDFEVNGDVISSYVQILDTYENGDMLVLHRTQAIQKGQTAGGSSYATPKNAKLQNSEQLYFVDADGFAFKMENHKKRVYREMRDEKADMVEDYIKEKNIKFEDDLRGLKGVARYYSSIR